MQGIQFENDVKMYGTQTSRSFRPEISKFENDVKMYGTQTSVSTVLNPSAFENDVKMYGTQTANAMMDQSNGLRMM